ncbi:hypothetical protein G5B39_13235 (plasmid) [Rhodobacteraceae bacterium SC52]|nr:hypothetical protein G5B39_13235 [Rhodobacteraceae bacterium SC52]
MLRFIRRSMPLVFAFGVSLGAVAPPSEAATLTVIGDVNAGSADNLGLYENVLNGGNQVVFSRGFGQLGGVVSHFRALGVTLTDRSALLTTAALTPVDLLVLTTNYNTIFDFSPAELAAIKAFGEGAGTVLLVAEAASATVLANYNAVLSALGAKIRFTGERFASTETLTELPETELSAGLTTFRVSPYSTLTGGSEAVTAANGTVVAFETLGAPEPVPLPPALPMLAGGVGALVILSHVKRRRRS